MFTKFDNESVKKFEKLLYSWDQYYAYSDDIRVYRAGKAQEENIIKITMGHPGFNEIFHKWKILTSSAVTAETTDVYERAKRSLLARESSSGGGGEPSITPDKTGEERRKYVPAETREKAEKQLDEIGEECKRYVPAEIYLTDQVTAKEYLCSRRKDTLGLVTTIEWHTTEIPGVGRCMLYEKLTVSRDFTSGSSEYDTLTEIVAGKKTVKRYNGESCMLAYILARYW